MQQATGFTWHLFRVGKTFIISPENDELGRHPMCNKKTTARSANESLTVKAER